LNATKWGPGHCCVNIAYSAFEEAIIATPKIHNLFIRYPNNLYFLCIGIPLKMEIRSIKKIVIFKQ
jgi:hypothetical protein